MIGSVRWGLAIGVALVLAAPTQASTTIAPESDASRPYARWVERSKVPTPDVELTVLREDCPGIPNKACAGWDYIYLAAAPGFTKQHFFHEMGHEFDYHLLTDDGRATVLGLMRSEGPWRTADGSFSPHELFAEAYSQCALGGWAKRHLGQKERPVLPRGRMHKVCELIRAAD